MQEYAIHPLVVGANETDQGVMTYLKGYGNASGSQFTCFTWRGGRRRSWWIPAWSSSWCPPRWGRNTAWNLQEFEEALDTYGLKPEDIDIIIHTHLHNDHCENDYKCTNAP